MTRSSWEGERTHSLKEGHRQRAVLSSALQCFFPWSPEWTKEPSSLWQCPEAPPPHL